MSKYLQDMRAGDNYSIKLTVNDLAGVPVDITGYKFWFTLKSSFDLSDAHAELQHSVVAGDSEDDDVVNGVCNLYIPAALTKSIPKGKYYYDIQQQFGMSYTTVLPPIADYTDTIMVVPEVTKSL